MTKAACARTIRCDHILHVTMKTTAMFNLSSRLCLPPVFQVFMLHRASMSVISAELSQVTYRHTPFRFFQLTQLSLGWGKIVFSPPGKVPIDHLMILLPLICIRGKCSYQSFMLAWTKIGATHRLRILRVLRTALYKHICFWSLSLDMRQMFCALCTYLPLSSIWSKLFKVEKNLKKKVQKHPEKWILLFGGFCFVLVCFSSTLDATGRCPVLWSSEQLLLNDSVRYNPLASLCPLLLLSHMGLHTPPMPGGVYTQV